MTDEAIVKVEQAPARQARLTLVAKDLKGPQFVSNIQGKQYPKVEWWTTIGAHAGLTALEVSSSKTSCADHDGEHYGYETVVEITDDGSAIRGRASMICLSCEVRSTHNEKTCYGGGGPGLCKHGEPIGSTKATWGTNGEYAVKSMALTRATSKAFRLNLSYLAVLAGLEATPADEVPAGGFSESGRNDGDQGHGFCPDHADSAGNPVAYFKRGNMRSPAHPLDGGGWCDKPEDVPEIVTDDEDMRHPGGITTPEDREEWEAAKKAVGDTLNELGYEFGTPERDSAVTDIIGDEPPSTLTTSELLVLAETLKERAALAEDEALH